MRRLVLLFVLYIASSIAVGAAEPRPAALDSAIAYASSALQDSGVPGYAIAVVHGSTVLAVKGYGSAGPGRGAVNGDTAFILGSTTKSFTALGVMQLVEAGKIALDAPVADYLPGFIPGRPITVRMLLNQTSGLSHSAGDQPVVDPGEMGPDAIKRWALALTPEALNRPIGRSYEYSNANYVVLGAVIEVVSGESYGSYLRAHVLQPLGMAHSYTSLEEARGTQLASGHRQWFGQFQASEVPYPASFVPAGFLITTANDMSRYLTMIAGNGALGDVRILSEASMTELHRGAAAFDESGKSAYAMGWVADTFNGIPVVYHDGDTGRFTSIMAVSHGARFGIVILANGSGWLHSPHMSDAANGAINLLEGKTPKSYETPYMLSTAVLATLTGIPALQFVFLLWSFFASTRVARSFGLGLLLPGVFNAVLALLFVAVVPRYVIGVPLIEYVLSLPDMGAAALLSAGVAVVWIARTARRMV